MAFGLDKQAQDNTNTEDTHRPVELVDPPSTVQRQRTACCSERWVGGRLSFATFVVSSCGGRRLLWHTMRPRDGVVLLCSSGVQQSGVRQALVGVASTCRAATA